MYLKIPYLPLSQSNTPFWIANNLMEKGLYKKILKFLDTFTVLLVWFILAVCISIASEGTINTLSTGTLELGLWAYRTIEFITVVFTFSKPITPPSHRDTINFSRETSKLLRRTCWGLFNEQGGEGEWQKQNNCHAEVTYLSEAHLIINMYNLLQSKQNASQLLLNMLFFFKFRKVRIRESYNTIFSMVFWVYKLFQSLFTEIYILCSFYSRKHWLGGLHFYVSL